MNEQQNIQYLELLIEVIHKDLEKNDGQVSLAMLQTITDTIRSLFQQIRNNPETQHMERDTTEEEDFLISFLLNFVWKQEHLLFFQKGLGACNVVQIAMSILRKDIAENKEFLMALSPLLPLETVINQICTEKIRKDHA